MGEHRIPQWAIDKYGLKRAKKIGELSFKGGGTDSSPRIGTPEPFRKLLIDMVKTVRVDRQPYPKCPHVQILSDAATSTAICVECGEEQ